MRRRTLIAFLGATISAHGVSAAESIDIDLAHWTAPDIATVGDDPFGELVKYGHALFTDTADEIGPTVQDPGKRFAGNNLACENCHLSGGAQPYAMLLMGIWGQFTPISRARRRRRHA